MNRAALSISYIFHRVNFVNQDKTLFDSIKQQTGVDDVLLQLRYTKFLTLVIHHLI